MKLKLAIVLPLSLIMMVGMAFGQTPLTTGTRYTPAPYTPGNMQLYKTVVRLDSIYFGAYNTGKGRVIDSLTADDLEFYHDRGGLLTSKPGYLKSLEKNIYGKVTRTLTLGSLEVYEIPNYGAIEFGYHSFTNITEPGGTHPSKFVIIWQHKGEQWLVSRVISLH
jgi:hypothetical protein